MESYDFIVPGRAVSMQSSNRVAFRHWLDSVAVAAIEAAPLLPPFWEPNVRLTIVFFCTSRPIDVDNVIKPIQDTLSLVFYADDVVVTDVDCHRRTFHEGVDPKQLPPLLRAVWEERRECTYVRVQETSSLETLL